MFHPFRLVRCVLMGANARAALGSPMASVVFTRGHFGTTHAADRLRARESTAECMQGRTRVVMGCPRARIRAHARTAKGARRASAVCVVFCSSLAPVWRARANTKTRDYRTFESAHRAQTACAPAHQRARKQAPQSVAQWLLPFSHTVPPRSSRTRPSRPCAGSVELVWKKVD
jgi:hypothetical protein